MQYLKSKPVCFQRHARSMVLAGIVVIEGSWPWRCAVRLSFRAVAAYRSGKTPNNAAQRVRGGQLDRRLERRLQLCSVVTPEPDLPCRLRARRFSIPRLRVKEPVLAQ